MIKGKTKTGFFYEIDEATLDDYETVELLGELDENPLLFPKVLKRILGTKQTIKLKNHVRDKQGHIPVSKMTREVEDIFKAQVKK